MDSFTLRRESSATVQEPSIGGKICRSDSVEADEQKFENSWCLIKINTAFIGCYFVFFAVIGGALIAVSGTGALYIGSSGLMLSEQTQDLFLTYVNSSSEKVFFAAGETVKGLMNSVLNQQYKWLEQKIDDFNENCILSVVEIADLWKGGVLNGNDMDTTLARLWILLMQFPSISFVNFATAENGDFIGIQRFPDGL
jgi:hypothetical protein